MMNELFEAEKKCRSFSSSLVNIQIYTTFTHTYSNLLVYNFCTKGSFVA